MVPTTLTLQTSRFVLSAPRDSDVDAIHAACQDPELQQYTTVPLPYTVDEARKFRDQVRAPGLARRHRVRVRHPAR